MFRFKQFSVDQAGCAMKVNTDGVLLGAMTSAENPRRILDIGTGTGVIALMLAQKFAEAQIDAVEIDTTAAETAGKNFENSVFKSRLNIHPVNIIDFLDEHPDIEFDLIVSNPPFYINSLESPEAKKNLAKHSEVTFFETLMKDMSEYLSPKGLCWLILPVNTATEVKELAKIHGLELKKNILIRSFQTSEPHREIVCYGKSGGDTEIADFVIYNAPGVYTEAYKELLKPYFLAF